MAKECNCGKNPCVIVPGIGQSKIVQLNEDGSVKKTVFPFDDIDTGEIIKRIVPRGLAMLVTRRNCGFARALSDAFLSQIEGVSCGTDGKPLHRVQTETYNYSLAECSEKERKFIYMMVPVQPLENHIGADHIYFYAYNAFAQSREAVDGLRDFIQLVKQQTGHSRVNLVPVSLGGTIATEYLGKYGDDGDIARVISVVPAYDGSVLLADIIADRLRYESYEEAFAAMLGKSTMDKINKYLRLIPKTVFNTALHTLMNDVVNKVCLNSSVVWGLVPAETYPALSEKMIGDAAHAQIKARTDEAYAYRRDFAATVAHERQKGVVFQNVCCHGLQILEFSCSTKVNSDHVVHAHSASMGAVFAPLGETLAPGYVQNGGGCKNPEHNHISPCRTVDASAGMIPDTTWFFKGQDHDTVQFCKPVMEVLEWLLADESEKDVYTDPRYPQFNTINKEDKA